MTIKDILQTTGIVAGLVGGLAGVILNINSACATAEAFERGYSRRQIENSTEYSMGIGETELLKGTPVKLVSAPGRYLVYGLDLLGAVEHGNPAKKDTEITSTMVPY